MTSVFIYHGYDEAGRFVMGDEDPAVLVKAYSYSADADRVGLSEIWRDNNVVTGDERPARYHKRSLSVGDVILRAGIIDGVQVVDAHRVLPIGFEKIEEVQPYIDSRLIKAAELVGIQGGRF